MKKEYFISAVIALIISLLTFYGVKELTGNNQIIKIEHVDGTGASKVLYTVNDKGEFEPVDFTKTADKVVNAVVHIKSSIVSQNSYMRQYRQLPDPFGGDDFFKFFFGEPQQVPKNKYKNKPNVQISTGSGVIINENGYIVTNNHVIEDAKDIEITLHDNRTYKAKVIGTDPTTDIALLQIKEKNLPYLAFVNSDDVKVGEWVMAVGNPFSLNSTVTAGIVSAKARNININHEQYAVESFIQTDAAINPGNSGGALVNLDGGLIGINTAIASPTGSYAGYGFAVPSNIVSKVVEDLLKYGVVQRGVLGVMIRSVDGNLAKEKDLKITEGAYVDSLLKNSAAEKYGIKKGDIIVAVNGEKVLSSAKLQELIAQHRPGDKVKILVNRKGIEKEIEVVLNNREGKAGLLKREHKELLNILGVELQNVTKEEAQKLDIKGGVKITKIYAGKLRQQTQVREGFIITKVNGKDVKTIKEFTDVLKNIKGGVMLEGIYEDIPGTYYYAFGL